MGASRPANYDTFKHLKLPTIDAKKIRKNVKSIVELTYDGLTFYPPFV